MRRTDSELVEFSEHVFYEMTMLVGIPKRYFLVADEVAKNALLESFAIHARQLVDFFYRAESQNIVATNYFDDPFTEWKQIRAKEDDDLKLLVSRASTEIAHLTWARTQPNKVWDLASIVDQIGERCVLFLDRVPPARISALDRVRFARMLQEHKDWIRMQSTSQSRPSSLTSGSSGSMTGITGKTCSPDTSQPGSW